MIQRIQSVWLLIASLVTFLTLKLSFYSGTHLTGNQYQQLNGTANILLLATTLALGVLTLVTIFLFRNRVMQLRLCVTAILLDLVLVFLYFRSVREFSRGEYAITSVLHLIIIIALVLAARAINKDENMVKDSNRLR